MKQLKEDISKALNLVNENEQYIIFNDGKAVQTNLSDDHEINVDDKFDFSEYYVKKSPSALEQEISDHVRFSSTIFLNKDVNLKIIHIGDDEAYMDYTIVVKSKVKVNIKNIYFDVINDSKIRLDILAFDNSKVTIYNYMNFHNKTSLVVNAYCLINANFVSSDLALNDQETNLTTNVYLLENGSNSKLTNVVLNASSSMHSYNYNILHNAKGTESDLVNYGIVKNNSNINFTNQGIIVKDAAKSNLKQKTKGIILDLYSSISAMPVLLIDEYDVMAAHGASIGAIDEEDLYYLMSRGLSRHESENLIVDGFIAPYFRGFDDESLLEYIQESIKKHLK